MSDGLIELRFAALTALVGHAREQWTALVRSDFDRFADIVNECADLVDGLLSELNVDTTPPTNLVYLPTKLTLQHRADNLLALDLLFRTLLEQDDQNATLLDEQLRLVASAA